VLGPSGTSDVLGRSGTPDVLGPGRILAGGELPRFAGALARRVDLWRHLVRHSDAARVYELIWADEHVNAWVICWSAGQDTGFHDHGQSAGGIHVVAGSLSEQRLGFGRPTDPQTVGPGTSLAVPASAIHRVFHDGGRPAVSVHAYSPPLTQMGDYRFAADGRLEREARFLAAAESAEQQRAGASRTGALAVLEVAPLLKPR
jgi:mannose-6-phosphate isomerase-like protein (cupin superfamily)